MQLLLLRPRRLGMCRSLAFPQSTRRRMLEYWCASFLPASAHRTRCFHRCPGPGDSKLSGRSAIIHVMDLRLLESLGLFLEFRIISAVRGSDKGQPLLERFSRARGASLRVIANRDSFPCSLPNYFKFLDLLTSNLVSHTQARRRRQIFPFLISTVFLIWNS